MWPWFERSSIAVGPPVWQPGRLWGKVLRQNNTTARLCVFRAATVRMHDPTARRIRHRAGGLDPSAHAQGNAQGFPNKTIRIIVPFTPGGSNDVVAREIASGLQENLKQTAVVENKPGGGGVIAYSFVAKSPPDGYLMLITPASFTMGPHLSRNAGYNPITEFAPINLVADVPFVMVVPPTLPARTLQEFIALAKNSPNKLTYGSVGVGTPQHLGGELFKMRAGVDLIHVPFRGATAAIPDLLAGRIDMFIGAINSLLPLIKEGKLRAIAAAGASARARCRMCRPLPRRACRRRGRLGRRPRGAGRHAARHRRQAQPRDRQDHRHARLS